jgi:hypothetical protein
MEKRIFVWISYGFIGIAIVAIIGTLICRVADVVDAHQKDGDLATWMGAIGTFGALIGTIWISMSETRLRHREERAKRQVISAQVGQQVRTLIYGLSQAIAAHKACITKGTRIAYSKVYADFSGLPMWSSEDTRDMLHSTSQCATHMSFCKTNLLGTLRLIEGADHFDIMSNDVKRTQFYSAMQRRLEIMLSAAELIKFEVDEILDQTPFSSELFPAFTGENYEPHTGASSDSAPER